MAARKDWHAAADFAQERMERYEEKATDYFDRALRARTRKRVAYLLGEARRYARGADEAAQAYDFALEKLREQEKRRERYEREQRKKRGPVKLYYGDRAGTVPTTTVKMQPEYEDFGTEKYAEWEFGFEYDALSGDKLSNVDVNFRVRRHDGKPFDAKEAARVMQYAREHRGRVPHGYMVYTIDWRSPHARNSRWKESDDVGDVRDNLINVIDAVADQPHAWRLGAPKD